MPQAYIIHRRWISYRRYIFRFARNGYHWKHPHCITMRVFSWWRLRESNPWPPACGAGALPTELNPQVRVKKSEWRVYSLSTRSIPENARRKKEWLKSLYKKWSRWGESPRSTYRAASALTVHRTVIHSLGVRFHLLHEPFKNRRTK